MPPGRSLKGAIVVAVHRQHTHEAGGSSPKRDLAGVTHRRGAFLRVRRDFRIVAGPYRYLRDTGIALRPLSTRVALRQLACLEIDAGQRPVLDLGAADGVLLQLRAGDGLLLQLRRTDRVRGQHPGGVADAAERDDKRETSDDQGRRAERTEDGLHGGLPSRGWRYRRRYSALGAAAARGLSRRSRDGYPTTERRTTDAKALEAAARRRRPTGDERRQGEIVSRQPLVGAISCACF